jgi:hypothetical protein
VQRVLVDIADVDTKSDLGSQVDDGIATGCRRREPIMIDYVVPLVECPVEDLDGAPAAAS